MKGSIDDINQHLSNRTETERDVCREPWRAAITNEHGGWQQLSGNFSETAHDHQNWETVRGNTLLDGAAPLYEAYETSDGKYMAVGAQEPQFHAALIAGLQLNSMIELSQQWDRTLWPSTKETISQRFRTKTLAEWRAVFDHVDACVTPVLEMSEIETPLAPLVELSDSPSGDVSTQEDYPILEKDAECEQVLAEWIPHTSDK